MTQDRLPSAVESLGRFVVATHPAGHQLLGRVNGAGTLGVSIAHPAYGSIFLKYDEGWSVRPTEHAPR